MSNPFDLKVLFPDYFSMWVFRVGVLLVLLLFVYTANSNDWDNDFKAYDCPASDFYDGCIVTSFDEYDGTFILAGSYIGKKPNKDFFMFPERTTYILLFVFVINHLLFMLRTKNLYPKRRHKIKV